ncbi:MAG TPA: hydrolase TatD, partial [Fusobacteria bacterium]|nr:hydrolase TatD [Fusobacteriota bacterium]
NFPKNVKYVAEELARIKGISFEDVVKATNKNSKIVFGL